MSKSLTGNFLFLSLINCAADIDASLYYKTLCSSGLGFINKQHGQIEQKRTHLVESKQKLVYNNYDSIIKFSSFSKDLIHDVSLANCAS